MNRKTKFLLYVLLFITLFNIDLFAQQDSISKLIDFQTKKFKSILEAMYEYSKDTIDIYTVSDSAFASMLRSSSEFNAYFPKSEWIRYFNTTQGKTVSIGLSIKLLGDTIFIFDVDKNSPAELAGIKRGNVLFSVNDIKVTKNNVNDINKSLFVQEGDSIVVKWMDYNSLELKTATLICKEYMVPSITANFILKKDSILFVKIDNFSIETGAEIKKIANELKNEKIKGIIIDLRNNAGGTLNTVISALDEFINKGDTVFKSFARKDEFKYNLTSKGNGSFLKIPLIVLINNKSASGSEIFAGAIQDLDRGIIIGEKSFGKGTMQKTWSLVDTTGYRITVAEFVTPSDRIIDKNSKSNKKNLLDTTTKIDEQLALTNKEVYDELNEKIKKGEFVTNVNIVYTKRKKRPIMANGGIQPDIIVIEDTLNLLTRVLANNGILIEFIFKNTNLFPKSNVDVNDFIFNYKVSDELLENFKVFSYNEKHIWNDEMYKQDKEFIRNKFKAYIAHYLWGKNIFNAVEAVNNNVVQQALINKSKAIDILK